MAQDGAKSGGLDFAYIGSMVQGKLGNLLPVDTVVPIAEVHQPRCDGCTWHSRLKGQGRDSNLVSMSRCLEAELKETNSLLDGNPSLLAQFTGCILQDALR